MSYAEDWGLDAWDEDYFEMMRHTESLVRKERAELDGRSEKAFLVYILAHGKREKMNAVIGPEFRAYDIAEHIREEGKYLSHKQRIAIRNVYLFAKYGIRNGLY